MNTLRIRAGRPEDRDAIVEFNARLARETEHKELDRRVLTRGVERALNEPGRLRYWVAERDGRIIGQSAISLEWSDWRDGWLWWLQSVYVVAEFRGQGVLKAILEQIRRDADAEGDVIGLRLYVEQANTDAQRAYQRLGLEPGGYLVLERFWRT